MLHKHDLGWYQARLEFVDHELSELNTRRDLAREQGDEATIIDTELEIMGAIYEYDWLVAVIELQDDTIY
jgi:hypothetical protein